MKNIRFFFSENFQFLVMKFSIYLNRHVFVMVVFSFNSSISAVHQFNAIKVKTEQLLETV